LGRGGCEPARRAVRHFGVAVSRGHCIQCDHARPCRTHRLPVVRTTHASSLRSPARASKEGPSALKEQTTDISTRAVAGHEELAWAARLRIVRTRQAPTRTLRAAWIDHHAAHCEGSYERLAT